MKKTYHADWKTYTALFVFLVIGAIFSILLGAQNQKDRFIGVVGIFILFVFAYFVIVSMRAYISDGFLFFSSFPFFQLYPKKTPVGKILEINRQPTFRIFKGKMRSLYIFYVTENEKTKWIELRPNVFKEETMGKLVRDLKQLNPAIKLDSAAQQLMEQAKQ